LRRRAFRGVGAGVAPILVAAVLAGCSDERIAMASEACSIDNIENTTGTPPSAPVGTKVVFAGWAGDARARRIGSSVVLWLVDEKGVVVGSAKREAVVVRPDVAAHYQMPEMARAGFRAPMDTTGLPKGTYEIMIESRFDIQSVACKGTQKIVLR
jgi:hypothetical protein